MTEPAVAPDPVKPIALVNRVGEVVALPPDEASLALKSGYRPATEEEWKGEVGRIEAQRYEAGKEAQFGGIAGAAGTFAQGLARTGTFGLSDVAYKLATQAAGGDPEQAAALLRAYREQSPIAGLAGELTGYVLPTPAGKALGAAGKLAETGAARLVGKGATSLLGRAAQGAATLGARGAVEGGVLGAQQELSEEVLGNEKLNAEKLLASTGRGMLAGGVALGAIGGAAPIAKAGANALAQASIRKLGGEGETLSEVFQSLKNNAVFKAIGGETASAVRNAERLEGGAQRIARDVSSELEKAGGKSWVKLGPEAIAEKVESRLEAVGNQIGELRSKLDAYAEKTGVRPNPEGFASRVSKEVIEPIAAMPGREALVSKLQGYVDSFVEKSGKSPSFKLWENFRKDLDSQIKWSARAGDVSTDALKSVRGILENEYEKTAESAAQSVGGKFADEHRELKRVYQSLKVADDLVRDKIVKATNRAAFGLSDYAAAAAGAAAGGPAGLLAGVAKKVWRDKGHEIMADVYGKLAKLTEVQAKIQSFDASIDRGIKGFTQGKAVPPLGAATQVPAAASAGLFKGKAKYDMVRKTVERVATLAANPAALSQHVAMHTQPIAMHAPNTSMAMAQTSGRAIAYLQKNAPQDQGNPSPLQPQLQKPTYSDTDVAAYARRLAAIENPLSILDDMRHNRLTPEAVDAVRQVYPGVFRQLQVKMQETVAQSKEKIPYDKIVQMSVLFETPLDGTMEPGFIKAVQAAFAEQQAQKPAKSAVVAGKQAIRISQMMKTPTEQLAIERP